MEYESVLEEDQLLKLPEEVFLQVFSYISIPSRANVSLVCRKFYSLMCELEKDKVPLNISFSQIYDDDIFTSLINSSRKFNNITIDLKGSRELYTVDRIEQVIRTFGHRVKTFKMWCSKQSEVSQLSESHVFSILECIPEVQDIVIRNLHVSSSQSRENFPSELNLHKLKKLSIDYSSFDSPAMLNRIPQDIIDELVFTFESPDEKVYQNFFNRQKNIKKLEIFENNEIKFEHLELEHIKISSSINFAEMIASQPKLRYVDFAITWIDDEVFAQLCNLKHLQVLKTLVDQVSCHQFKSLNELVELKELRLDSHTPSDSGFLYELSMMKLQHLEKLTLLCTERKILEEIIIQMSNSFIRMKHIELINRSINIIGTILESFANLESLLLDFFAIFGAPDDILSISDDFKHLNLKQLVITNININESENTKALLKLINVCPNLERIILSKLTLITTEEFVEILVNHPNLTKLSIDSDDFCFNEDVIFAILNYGSKLDHIRLNGLISAPSYSTIKTLFEEKFSSITSYTFSTGDSELIMKKRNVENWYLNFRLMDHF